MSQHQRLSQLRIKLLHLHKLLLETERLTYEQVRGHVSGGELLQLAIGHEQFAWLHRLSELIIQIDELLHADESVTPEAIEAIDSDIRTLLSPDESGGVTAEAHDMAVRRMVQAGAVPINWMAVLAEWQRDWARTETTVGVSDITLEHGGASAVALAWELQLLATTPPAIAAGDQLHSCSSES